MLCFAFVLWVVLRVSRGNRTHEMSRFFLLIKLYDMCSWFSWYVLLAFGVRILHKVRVGYTDMEVDSDRLQVLMDHRNQEWLCWVCNECCKAL